MADENKLNPGSANVGSPSAIGNDSKGPGAKDEGSTHPNPLLVTNQGRPVGDNQNSVTAGRRGPTTLDDFQLFEKMAQFNRERIPERVVHAKGTGVHGHFLVTHDITKYTTAKLFAKVGNTCDMFARFSTVGGEKGSADTARDPRGFALKFYTEEGNWDMVGNNTPVFFIRDAIKFGDFIHTQKREPSSNLKSATMMWDFWSLSPESLHQVTILFSDRGIPDGFRHMNGYSSHTFSLINKSGERFYCKWHFKTVQGIKNIRTEEAERLAGADPDYSQRDMTHAIEKKDFPSWRCQIQIMPEGEIDKFKYNPFDLTKVWPHGEYPVMDVGVMTLDRMPSNYFAETEQSAFNPSNIVPGMGYSPDKMLQGRLLSYPDAHRYRVGTNYDLLPINARCTNGFNYNRDGAMRFDGNGGDLPNYEPNSFGGPKEDPHYRETPYQANETLEKVARYDHREGNDDYAQVGNLWRLFDDGQKDRTAKAIAGSLGQTPLRIQKLQLSHFKKADPDYAHRVATFLGNDQHPEYRHGPDAAELAAAARVLEK
ncbi:MAG: catalase [Acidobacteriota bacterium]|nr:catalase [Acidobacteriota bacterium]